jgi:diguanylate cyclase (GGDEF)-like protein
MNTRQLFPAVNALSASQPDLHRELQRLIDQRLLTPLFQPIFALDSPRILGYEALIRGPETSPLHKPEQLFAVARSARHLASLEYACREAACRQFMSLGLPGKLFLNMSPLSFTDNNYRDGVTREILQRVGLNAERLVFELTENQPLDEFELLRSASDHFKRQGFAVALDDLGAGYAGLRVWSELRPDYVKIDRHFISGIDQDAVKREFVRAMLDIAHRMGNKVIAEGIETAAELRTLITMGVEYAQGFYLARPMAEPVRQVPSALFGFQHERFPRHPDFFHRTVGDILADSVVVSPGTPAAEVVKMFRADVRLTCVPVVAGNQPIGMVSRVELLNIFAQRYGHELHSTKLITEFISPLSLTVEIDTELKVVGQLITEDPQQNLSVDFIISEQGLYRGVGTVRNLLRCITEEKLRAARHSNPLTQLPGNVPLYEWIDYLLNSYTEFVVAYCDINHFKPFNDTFGYSYGDEVIVKLGQLLMANIDTARDFVGHVGGDDFIVVFRSDDWRARCEHILASFSEIYHTILPTPHNEYWSQDREGNRQRFGPLTLAIGCVQPDPLACMTHHQVALLLADAKHSAKRSNGNCIFESRRRTPYPS